ncbi:uncharacterized protein [Nicotiana tomentosiformis]|uniref:uncharacterized protein n=1 Tax=Nicotiana tomentosiformis TaxID=4098 RepID=UPI00388C7934
MNSHEEALNGIDLYIWDEQQTWWEAYERCRPVGAVPLTWREFFVLILEKFVPLSRRAELHRQFEQLRQDDMFVIQYKMRFFELARPTVWFVPTDRERIRRFINGLTDLLRLLMTRERVSDATFDEVVDIAQQIETVRSQEREEREAKRTRGSGGPCGIHSRGQSYYSRGHPYWLAQMAHPVHRGASSGHGSYNAHPGQSSLNALPTQSSSRAPSVQG